MSDWIKCSERLPETHGMFSREVLASMGNPRIAECCEIVTLHDAITGGRPREWRNRRGEAYSLGWFRYWQPLLEPPEEA